MQRNMLTSDRKLSPSYGLTAWPDEKEETATYGCLDFFRYVWRNMCGKESRCDTPSSDSTSVWSLPRIRGERRYPYRNP